MDSTNRVSKGQQSLPFERKDKLALIDRAELELPGKRAPTIANVKLLLKVLVFCTGRDGCFPRVEVICHKMGVMLGHKIGERTVRRATACAKQLGILRTIDRPGSNIYVIDWDALRSFTPAPGHDGRTCGHDGRAPGHDGRAINHIHTSSSETQMSSHSRDRRRPRLPHCTAEDLRDNDKLWCLHYKAVREGIITDSEQDRLRFVAAAKHVLHTASRNPPGLLSCIIQREQWGTVSHTARDEARRVIGQWDRMGIMS